MKLAILADIHGNMTALDAVLQDLDTEPDIDQIWVLGDLAAHGPHPAACVETIRERHEANKETFKVIGGNTDRYLVNNTRIPRPVAEDAETYEANVEKFAQESAMFDWARGELGWENYEYLSKLVGREIGQTVPGYGYVCGYHAIPGDDEYVLMPDAPEEEARDTVLDRPLRLGIYGHIHRQVDRDLGSVRLVNPGSVGLSFERRGFAQYAVLTFTDGELSVDLRNLPFDVDGALELAKEAGHPAVSFLEQQWKGEA